MNLMHSKTNLVDKKLDELNIESAIVPKNMTNLLPSLDLLQMVLWKTWKTVSSVNILPVVIPKDY